MATKSKMERARMNAYTKGYKEQSKDIGVVIRNPYPIGTRSKTDAAFDQGCYDAKREAKMDPSCVINMR